MDSMVDEDLSLESLKLAFCEGAKTTGEFVFAYFNDMGGVQFQWFGVDFGLCMNEYTKQHDAFELGADAARYVKGNREKHN